MGTVFAATHKNNGSRAAIKILHPEFSRDHDTTSRFIQEGYAANQVGHSGVVRILDDDTTEEGLPYMVMELLEGELLEQRRIGAGGRLPFEEVYDVADQLLEIMVAAHAKGIVHRDIKPDNIFVTNEGYLKVLDFGFARMRDGLRKEQTATGFLLGTPGFMAPEQAVGTRGQIDARTDVWAIGATLFVLLTGQPVHEGETAAEMLVAAANYPVRPIGELMPGLPVKFRQIVDRALAFDRNARFTDAKSMLLAVRSAMGHGASLDDDPSTVMRPSPFHTDSDETADLARTDERPPEMMVSLYTPTSTLRNPGRAGASPAPEPIEPEHVEDAEHVEIHPADAEQRTLALDPHAPTVPVHHLGLASPAAGRATAKGHAADEPVDHTLMMSSRPMNLAGIPSPLGEPLPAPATAPMAPPLTGPRIGSSPSYPDLSRVPQPAPSQPRLAPPPVAAPPGAAISAPAQRPAPPDSRFSSALVFIAVAGITMVVVILTGLVVIVGTE